MIPSGFILFLLLLGGSQKVVYDSSDQNSKGDWVVVDDVVMGGRSQGNIKFNDAGNAVFYGKVSLENYGGFSSVRYRVREMHLEGLNSVKLKVKGDGKNYQFRLKRSKMDRYSYIREFKTTGSWEELSIDLRELYPSFRGRKLDQPNYTPGTAEEFTFLIANGRAEEFNLEIKSIRIE